MGVSHPSPFFPPREGVRWQAGKGKDESGLEMGFTYFARWRLISHYPSSPGPVLLREGDEIAFGVHGHHTVSTILATTPGNPRLSTR